MKKLILFLSLIPLIACKEITTPKYGAGVCKMMYKFDYFRVHVRAPQPAPENYRVSVDGNVVFDTCRDEGSFFTSRQDTKSWIWDSQAMISEVLGGPLEHGQRVRVAIETFSSCDEIEPSAWHFSETDTTLRQIDAGTEYNGPGCGYGGAEFAAQVSWAGSDPQSPQ